MIWTGSADFQIRAIALAVEHGEGEQVLIDLREVAIDLIVVLELVTQLRLLPNLVRTQYV